MKAEWLAKSGKLVRTRRCEGCSDGAQPQTSPIYFMRLLNYSECSFFFRLQVYLIYIWQFNLHKRCLYPRFWAHFSDLWLIAYIDVGIVYGNECN